MQHYLDNAATTRVCEAAAEAVVSSMLHSYGNPSSAHSMGIEAERNVRLARERVAKALGCASDEIIFTSGGTEANNLAIFQAQASRRKGRHVITTAVEHKSLLEPVAQLEQSGFEVNLLRVGQDGLISLDELESLIRGDTVMLSMSLICNETGARMPVEEAAHLFKSKNPDGIMHVDASQAFCKEIFTPRRIAADMVTVSSHKIHGPKGAGALYARKNLIIKPLIVGGGQERDLRSGTEAVPAVVGFGVAAEEGMHSFSENSVRLGELRERLLAGIADIAGVTLIASGRAIFNLALPKQPSEVTVRLLEGRGIYVSSGAACGRGKPSHVLSAMKVDPKLMASSIRVSTSWTNTAEDIEALLQALREIA